MATDISRLAGTLGYPEAPWVFRKLQDGITELLVMDGHPKPLIFKLSTKAVWPFLYLDTAYWHALDSFTLQPACHRSQEKVEYLVHLRTVARQTLCSLPAVFIMSTAWLHVEWESRTHEKVFVEGLFDNSYMIPFAKTTPDGGRSPTGGYFVKVLISVI